MQRYILSSLAQSALVLLGVFVLVFFMVRLTGDPTTVMLAREASPEQRAAFREQMGFDRPLPVQFVDFVAKALVGNFGNSLHYRTPALPLAQGHRTHARARSRARRAQSASAAARFHWQVFGPLTL